MTRNVITTRKMKINIRYFPRGGLTMTTTTATTAKVLFLDNFHGSEIYKPVPLKCIPL